MRQFWKSGVGMVLVAAALLAGKHWLESSDPVPGRRNPASDSVPAATERDYYLSRIQPLFAARCINCHGCSASPCELKLDSFEGLDRGATKLEAYGANLRALPPLRLKDAHGRAAWDARGFFSVVARAGDAEARLRDSLLYRFVEQGVAHNGAGFDLSGLAPLLRRESPARDNACVAEPGEFAAYVRRFPNAGMPFALPALEPAELATLREWIAAGAPGPSSEARAAQASRTPPEEAVVAAWESFFNPGADAPERRRAQAALVSRYIYEHVFLAHVALEGVPGKFFELVRADAPYPAPVREIVTAQPTDAPPAAGPVYYRLKPYLEAVAQKSHLAWLLDAHKKERLEAIFYGADWGAAPIAAAGYRTSNPFITFARIPAVARARFMFEDSRLIANGMIRGPVCVGNTATYAIRDDFWVFFAKPETDPTVLDPTLGYGPAELENMMAKSPLGKLSYRQHYEQTVRRFKPRGYGLADIWDGEGQNPNAALTILRHQTNATVLQGALGPVPRTLWFMTYSGFERLYYDLVAQYMYWKGAGHALETWSFMSTLREGFEEEFLSLLPMAARPRVRGEWTRGLGRLALEALPAENLSRDRPSSIENIDNGRPVESLLWMIRRHLGERVFAADAINGRWQPMPAPTIAAPLTDVAAWERGLAGAASASEGRFSRYVPEVVHLLLRDGARTQAYSLLVNRWYKFNNLTFSQANARDPSKDTFVALRGVVGDFPELFVDLSLERAGEFLEDLTQLDSPAAGSAFQAKWGLLRNSPRFWPFLDELQRWNFTQNGLEAGALDLNRYRGY